MWVITGLSAPEVDSEWDTYGPMVEEALRNGGSLDNVDRVHSALMQSLMQFWTICFEGAVKGCIITAVDDADKAKVLRLVALSGKGMWGCGPELDRTLRVFAAAHGCRFMTLDGRRGWVKRLKEYGWRVGSVKMYKEI